MSFVAIWLLAVMMLPQKGGDLLTLMPTQAYWEARNVQVTPANLQAMAKGQTTDISQQIKQLSSETPAEREAAIRSIAAAGPSAVPQLQELAKSSDPRLSKLANNLIQQASRRGKEGPINRLMAIRTLGEMKEQSALPLLRELATSKDAFVGEYATVAIAQIEGKPLPQRVPVGKEAREKDLWILPADCGIVAQLDLSGVKDLTPAVATTSVPATEAGAPARGFARMLRGALMGLDQVGNMRIDTITIGVSNHVGDNQGWFVLIGRGRYDYATLTDLLRRQGAMVSTVAGQAVYKIGRNMQLVLPDENTLVLVTGASEQEISSLNFAEVLKSGQGMLKSNEAMAAALNVTDRSAMLYATAMMSDSYRALPLQFPMPFEMVRLTANPKGGKLMLNLQAEGTDAAAVTEAAGAYRKLLEGAMGNISAGAGNHPAAKIALDFLNSIKIETAEMQLTAKAELDLSNATVAAEALGMH